MSRSAEVGKIPRFCRTRLRPGVALFLAEFGPMALFLTGSVSPSTLCLSPDRIHSTSLFGLCPEVLRVYGFLPLRVVVPDLPASEQADNACSTSTVTAKESLSLAVPVGLIVMVFSSVVSFVSY